MTIIYLAKLLYTQLHNHSPFITIENKGFKVILWIYAIIEPNVSGFVSDFPLDLA
ncbi:hypothetical protein [Gilliamella sp. Bif1-4]|uniref:hypothetical protein n=1 Tax=Gilliamella sp. Bif1-4 TaxID=3120233 RepID=UPI00159EE092|nr:hypothetical protein [Gilliamella apicola]